MARGSVSLIVLFLFFVFSGLGLSMIYLAQVHLRMNAFRKSSLFLDYASENGIKRGLEDLVDALGAGGGAGPLSESTLEEFREDPAAVFPRLLEEGLGAAFPRDFRESEAGANWKSVSTCGLRSAEDRGGHFRILAGLALESSGGLDRLRPRRRSSLEATLGLLAGRVPLPAIPLLIDKEMSAAERSDFMRSNGISLVAADGNLAAPPAPAAAGAVIPKDATPLLAKALDVRIFKPQDLSPAKLRQALGLEPSGEPVPEGVYLIRTDLGLGGVYVQGDLDEMVLAIDGDAQVIAFRLAAGDWVLRFSPSRSRTEFATPAGVSRYDASPLGIVVVSGRVGALGGGVVDGDGEVTLVRDTEVPSVLSGVGLTIVSSGKVTLASHLILQGVRWQDGIPYIKEPQTQLVIFSTGRDFMTQAEIDSGIGVAAGAPQELKLQASLTAAGGPVEIGGSGKTVELLGALHAPGYDGHGNTLRIVRDERAAAGGLDGNVPVTAEPRLCLYALRVVSWREHE
ncbi:MAG TPA: hypothetical protein VMS75_11970 [Terriglobales bacterium]|nr:hypothetical protein [Terriglobales bacterium]